MLGRGDDRAHVLVCAGRFFRDTSGRRAPDKDSLAEAKPHATNPGHSPNTNHDGTDLAVSVVCNGFFDLGTGRDSPLSPAAHDASTTRRLSTPRRRRSVPNATSKTDRDDQKTPHRRARKIPRAMSMLSVDATTTCNPIAFMTQ